MLILISCSREDRVQDTSYLQNRPPLKSLSYIELPLGTVRPEGWLLQQLHLMKEGMTGHLDEWYPSVVGERNGWLGGDGDGWERGPYWLDGLLPLAWLLEDEELKAKVMPWIEWTLQSRTDEGYFGPVPFEVEPEPESGLQKTRRKDWWPKMVMLKVLRQYYEVTGDERVVELMLAYFRYQLNELPETPLDHWSFWANRRGGDNLMIVYWLYNLTGESFLLDLADLIHEQTFPWTRVFLNQECYLGPDLDHLYPYNTENRYPFDMELIDRLCIRQIQSFHCVNLAQGIKAPIIRYQQESDQRYVDAVNRAFSEVRIHHGQPQGMYGGDEPMHGKDPTQGIELCSVVEMMYSLEKIISVTGDPSHMDRLEKIAYNALPAQISDDFSSRQYFQQANQVKLTRSRHNFYEEDHHGHTDLCFGLLTGYPCCTCNMHQGWPKLITHMWYATTDGGLASVIYGPCRVKARVAGGSEVSIVQDTDYPFDDRISIAVHPPEPTRFPLYLRIPGWCNQPSLELNGNPAKYRMENGMAILDRQWEEEDVVEVYLPSGVRFDRWVENAVSVEKGPLVYVLRVEERWRSVENSDRWGDYREVTPASPWNYGLVHSVVEDPEHGFEEIRHPLSDTIYPWNLDNAPLALRTEGKRIADWTLYRDMAGPLPHSLPLDHLQEIAPSEILLVPYGCSKLRITEFPVVR